jgi:hypothetical protein
MTYSTQLKRGKIVEKEHYPTYKKMLAYHQKTGKCLPKEKFAEDIAKDHLRERPNDYYTRLDKAGL